MSMPYAGPEQQEPMTSAPVPPLLPPPPAAPAPEATAPAMATPVPNAAAATWQVARGVVLGVWHGRTVEALGMAETSAAVTGGPSRYWLSTAGAWAALAGMTVATYLIKSANATVSALDSVMSGITLGLGTPVADRFHLGFGHWLGVWLLATVIAFACLALRAATVRWTFAVRGASVPFLTGANIVAAAYTLQIPVIALAFLITLVLPAGAGSTILLVLLGLAGWIPGVVAEGLIYIGLNRTVRFTKSPLVPHAVMTLVWGALCTLVGIVAETVVLSAILR